MTTEEQHHQHARSIVGTKIVAALVLGLGSFVLSVLPVKTSRWWRPKVSGDRRPQHCRQEHDHGNRPRHEHLHVGDSAATGSDVASTMILFGGGVLLSTSLMHLMPEVRESAEALRRLGRMPGAGIEHLADLVCCAGFFATCVADELAHAVLAWYHRRPEGRGRTPAPEEPTDVPLSRRDGGVPETDDRDADVRRPRDETASDPDDGRRGSLQGLFTVLALSFHEVFEGLALGLERRREIVWQLFFAVASHKFVIAFCVGLDLVWSNTRRAAFFVYVATFAAMTLVGVALGMAIDQFDDRATVDGLQGPVAVLLQAFAAGTLLYVVFFEILPKHRKSGWPHLLAFMSGFVVMLLLQRITHNHSHGNYKDHDHYHNHDHVLHNI